MNKCISCVLLPITSNYMICTRCYHTSPRYRSPVTDVCFKCGGQVMNCSHERCCVKCGLVYGEAIPDREYQPDIKQIVKEYKKYYNRYIYFGGRHFPLNAFKIAAKYFSII